MIRSVISNKEIAKILMWYSDYIALESGKPDAHYRRRAYEEASKKISSMEEPIDPESAISIDGIGPRIAAKIKEISETGRLSALDVLIKRFGDLRDMTTVVGVGIKTAYKFKKEFGITTAKELIDLVNAGKITSKTIVAGIANKERRLSRSEVESTVKKIEAIFHEKPCRFDICGSWRRGKETIKDLDALTDLPLAEARVLMQRLGTLIEDGQSKISTLVDGIKFELRVTNSESYGSFLLHLTGPWPYNQHLRKIAKTKGFTLNEYGLHKENENKAAFLDEKQIVEILDESFISPEERRLKYERD